MEHLNLVAEKVDAHHVHLLLHHITRANHQIVHGDVLLYRV